MTDSIETHYKTIVDGFIRGQVVPFLGAGVNRCDRREGEHWCYGDHGLLPDGAELARHLAAACDYPDEDENLPRVSQYVSVMRGPGRLYTDLHTVFDADYPLTAVHRLLASLPAMLREKEHSQAVNPLYRQLLIVTTNYDDVLECAFRDANEPFHVVKYDVSACRFCHTMPSGESVPIENAKSYLRLDDEIPVILKIHGTIDRRDRRNDSYVITEDDYIDYSARVNLPELLPDSLLGRLGNSYVLFLGYGLRDWNVRIILRHLWEDPLQRWNSWAIQLAPSELDRKTWERDRVTILDIRLEDYIAEVERRLRGLTGPGGDHAA